MHFLIVLIGSVLCCTFADANKETCEDDPNWLDSHFTGDGTSICSDMTQAYCNDFGDYSVEARRACPKTCGICLPDTCGCKGWRQTANCDPNGPREPQNDKGCFATIDRRPDASGQMIESKVSGYCECADGRKTMQKGCSWGSHHTCKAACCNEKRQITRDGLQCVNWRFKGKSYKGCSLAGSSSPWCATSTTRGEYNDWNWCDETGTGHD